MHYVTQMLLHTTNVKLKKNKNYEQQEYTNNDFTTFYSVLFKVSN